ncbi:MAG: hypothetical protein KGL04_07985, partial [Elusimicrobia bacterium]|nr:hypothetical protein [Elusimicrobiota bacterium]
SQGLVAANQALNGANGANAIINRNNSAVVASDVGQIKLAMMEVSADKANLQASGVNALSSDYQKLYDSVHGVYAQYNDDYNKYTAAVQSGNKLVGDVNGLVNSTPLGQPGDISLPLSAKIQLPPGDGPGFIKLMNQETGSGGSLSPTSQDRASLQKMAAAIKAIGNSGQEVDKHANGILPDEADFKSKVGAATAPTPAPAQPASPQQASAVVPPTF